jgi:hypothetical protein
MQIVLKSNFDVAGMLGDERVQLREGASVRILLDLLAERCGLDLIDSQSGQVNGTDFRILLNGNEHPFWPQGLSTRLRDADEVQILVTPLAGG